MSSQLRLAPRAFFSMPEPEPPKPEGPNFRIRVCSQCIKRGTGGGFDASDTLRKTAEGAAAAGWPAPSVEMGGCLGGCDDGPNLRLVEGEFALPVVVDGMTEDEVETKAFLTV